MELNSFPPVVDGKIDTEEFLKAVHDVIELHGRLGKCFIGVKMDMQGNVEKITKYYLSDKLKHLTLQDMLLNEKLGKSTYAALSLLWLIRALHSFELTLKQILDGVSNGTIQDNMKEYLVVSYEEAVRPYHRWLTQQFFYMTIRIPGLTLRKDDFLKALNVPEYSEDVLKQLRNYVHSLHENRIQIFQFLNEHGLNDKTPV